MFELVVWVTLQHFPLFIEFDEWRACREVEISLERQTRGHHRFTPQQLFGPGYYRYEGRSTPYFWPCRKVEVK